MGRSRPLRESVLRSGLYIASGGLGIAGIGTSTDIFIGRNIAVGADGISLGPAGRMAEFLAVIGDCPAV